MENTHKKPVMLIACYLSLFVCCFKFRVYAKETPLLVECQHQPVSASIPGHVGFLALQLPKTETPVLGMLLECCT
jgi:hypothetical protein